MSVPNRFNVVASVAVQYAHLLKTNTYRSAAEFTQRVLNELQRTDPADGFGATLKNAGENGYTFPDGIRRSHDVITHGPTGTQIDILVAGGGREEPGPEGPRDADVKWAEIDRAHYRQHNVWVEPYDFSDDGEPLPPHVPSEPVDPALPAAYDTLDGFVKVYDYMAAIPPAQRPNLSLGEIIAALKNLRDACARILETERP